MKEREELTQGGVTKQVEVKWQPNWNITSDNAQTQAEDKLSFSMGYVSVFSPHSSLEF